MKSQNAEWTLHNDRGRNLRFRGEKVAGVSNRSYSGPRQSRWTEIDAYRTQSGRLVVHVVRRTQWQGEETTCEARAFAPGETEALVEWLGLGDLAKELYDAIDVAHAEVVE